ncbi:unnamed protein product [Ectocarpus sp. 6 AP-2014]
MSPTWRYVAVVAVAALVGGGPARRGSAEAAAATRKSEEERRAEYERFVDKMMDSMPADELAEELVGVFHRTMDSEKRERRRRELERDFDTDDEALLERIGRLVVQWVNTRLTPRTDEECDWSWGRWRCDPQCSCQYKYRFGDYAPGRSCRLRPEGDRELATCDPERGNDVSLLEKLAAFVGKVGRSTWRFTAEHVVPQTDKDCRFSLAHSLEEKKLVCTPRRHCAFHYKFGDVHPGRSCRLRDKSGTSVARIGGNGRAGDDDGGYGEDGGERWSVFDWGDGSGGSSNDDFDDDSDGGWRDSSGNAPTDL